MHPDSHYKTCQGGGGGKGEKRVTVNVFSVSELSHLSALHFSFDERGGVGEWRVKRLEEEVEERQRDKPSKTEKTGKRMKNNRTLA